MADPQFQVRGLEEVTTLLSQLPERTFKEVKQVFTDGTFAVQKAVRGRLDGDPLQSRTGEMKRSFKPEVRGTTLETLRASVFSGTVGGKVLVYVPIHEFGGTIKAKDKFVKSTGSAKLSIPLPPNLTESGVMRMTPWEVFQAGGFVFQSGSGKWFLAGQDGEPLFILKEKVTIKARLGFYDIADRQSDIIISELSSKLPDAWRK